MLFHALSARAGRSAVTILLLSCLALALRTAVAHPVYWHAEDVAQRTLLGNVGPNSVCNHPDKAYGLHGLGKGPLQDSGITFQLTKDGQSVTTYCPGTSLDVKVGFEEARQAFLTTSLGSFKHSVKTCGGRSEIYGYALNNKRYEDLTNTVNIPCGVTGDLQLKVTSALNSLGRYLQSSATFKQSDSCPVCK